MTTAEFAAMQASIQQAAPGLASVALPSSPGAAVTPESLLESAVVPTPADLAKATAASALPQTAASVADPVAAALGVTTAPSLVDAQKNAADLLKDAFPTAAPAAAQPALMQAPIAVPISPVEATQGVPPPPASASLAQQPAAQAQLAAVEANLKPTEAPKEDKKASKGAEEPVKEGQQFDKDGYKEDWDEEWKRGTPRKYRPTTTDLPLLRNDASGRIALVAGALALLAFIDM